MITPAVETTSYWDDVETKKSIYQLRTSRFPGAYFLHHNAILRSLDDFDTAQHRWWEDLRNTPDISSTARLDTKIREEIRRYIEELNSELLVDFQAEEDKQARSRRETPRQLTEKDVLHHDSPLQLGAQLVYLQYSKVYAKPGILWLVCPDNKCGRLYRMDAAAPNFSCKVDGKRLQQLSHIFVHPICGTVSEMVENRGPRKCSQCEKPMRLFVYYKDMAQSKWWCADGHPKVEDPVLGFCHNCHGKFGSGVDLSSTDPTRVTFRMTLIPARTLYHACSLSAVDVPDAHEETVLEQWFGGGLTTLPTGADPVLDAMMQANPSIANLYSQTYRQLHPAASLSVNPNPVIRSELRDYAGALMAKPLPLSTLLGSTTEEESLFREFGVRPRMLQENLAVVNATFGALVGGSDPAQALFHPFHMHGARYGVLADRIDAEAILFELDPVRVLIWLQKRVASLPSALSSPSRNDPEKALRLFLMQAGREDPLYQNIVTLLHTISHLLIRSSERNSGISRENLREMVWPRALAFVLYDHSGLNLGNLRNAFEGAMLSWFSGARYDVDNCPNDPLCASDSIRACHACLFLPERNCTTYWNHNLDRELLVTTRFGAPRLGYWEM